MTVTRARLAGELNALLQPDRFRDYCPNGLQVQGRDEITRLVTGVTASQDLIDAAVDEGADAILVHHGYFWRGEDPVITGMKRQRIKTLLDHDISLFAYHLPLDAHPELGNNAKLGQLLGFESEGRAGDAGDEALVMLGSLPAAFDHDQMLAHLEEKLGRQATGVAGNRQPIRRIAWCTGAAQGFIEVAIAHGADAYITGEISEQTTHAARENSIHFFAAGHHATERYGVEAVGVWLAERFGVQHQFIDIDNPA